MLASDGKVIISTELDNSKIPKGIGQVKGQLGGLSNVVGKLGVAIAAAFSVRTIVNFSKACLDLGSDLQEVQNVVDVTFTTMNEQVNEFAQNAAQTAGLSETMAKRYAGTFGAMAKSFKFTEAEAYEMSTALTQLAGDVASFYNLSQDAAYTKLKSVFSGETETLKDLGVVMTQSALDAFALQKGLKKTTSQMTEQEKVALRYQFVMEQLSGASGDFVRTSDSWANQTRLLNLQWEQLMATLGQGLINVLTPVVQWLNTIISKLQEAANAFESFTDELFGNAGGSTGAVIEGASDSLGSAADNAGELEENAKKAKRALAGFDEITRLQSPNTAGDSTLGDLGSVGNNSAANSNTDKELPSRFKDVIKQIKDFAKDLAAAFEPTVKAWDEAFAGIAPAIDAAKPKIKQAWERLKQKALIPFSNYVIFDYFPSISNMFSETFAPIFEDVMVASIEGFTIDFQNQCLLIEEACKGLQTVFEGVKKVFGDMCESISLNWQQYGGSLLQGFLDFKASTWDIWWNLYNTVIVPVLTSWGNTLSGLWDNHLKPLWDSIVAFFMSVGDSIMRIWNGFLGPVLNWLIDVFGPVVSAVLNGIGDAFSIVVGVVADVIGGILGALSGLMTFISGVFTLDWGRAWQGIVDVFNGIIGAIVGIFKGVINAVIFIFNFILDVVNGLVTGLINAIGGIAGGIGSLFGQNWYFSMDNPPIPKIPYLAQGAVLPPNKPFMAMVGDQRHGTNIEAPLSTIQEAVAQVMADYEAANLAGHEATVDILQQILSAVLGIEVGDTTIGQAANRYNQKMAIIKGGL